MRQQALLFAAVGDRRTTNEQTIELCRRRNESIHAALHGIVHGIIGLTQHAPAWSEFAVVPRLSNISYANIAVPTMRGTIEINVTRAPPRLSVRVPCSTLATLCLQLPPNPTTHRALHVDGVKVSATTTAHHVCADEPLACKVAPRVLTFI